MGVYGGGQNIVTDGLVFYVDAANKESYTGNGTTWSDMVGDNNGTLENGPTFDSGNGGSIVFDGSDDNVSFDEFNTSGIDQLSVESWVYINDDISDGTVVGLWGNNDSVRSFMIYWDVGDGASNFDWIVKNTSFSNLRIGTTIANGNNNEWNHVLGTFNSSNSEIKLYINGEFFSSNTGTTTPFVLNSTTGFEIGDDGSNSRRLKGSVAVTKIYNRVLSSSEVNQNYNALKGRFGL